MSQNKTVVPESEYDYQNPTYSGINRDTEFYRPSSGTVNSTVISGINGVSAPPPVPTSSVNRTAPNSQKLQTRQIALQERVIIGVLFSISKGLLGELFPIYLGRNMIGSSSYCDISLKEMSVSEEHAVLYARCDEYPGECFLMITDYGSSYGTGVNEKDCNYNSLTVKDGDILTIGQHYRLIVKLFDVGDKNLFEDSGFVDKENSANLELTDYQSNSDFYSPSRNASNDNRTVIV